MLDRFYKFTSIALQLALVVGAVAYALDLYRKVLGWAIFGEQLLAISLGAAIALVFVQRAMELGSAWRLLGLVYALAGAVTMAGCVYIGLNYAQLSMLATTMPTDALVTSVILVVALMEALRLAGGLGILAVVLLFLVYGAFGHFFPGEFQSRETTPLELAVYLAIDSNGILGMALQVAVVVVVPYVLFGQMLARLGAGDFFNDISLAGMGKYRGGTAKVAVTASGLFGTISGSAVGNVVGTGIVTIPMMKRSGVAPHYAAAIEAVASTGGQLVPPVMGAAAFIMADFIGVPYGEVMVAALLPGVLYYVALFIHVDLLAAKQGISGISASQRPSAKDAFKSGWYFILPFALLFYVLLALNMRPELAAMWAAGLLLVIHYVFGYKGHRASLRELFDIAVSAGAAAKELLIVCAGAGIIIGVLNLTGLAFNLTMHIVAAAGGSLILLAIITGLISIVLGMGMPTVGVYILLATLVVPALVAEGISLMAAHLFVFYFGLMSMITPPVALAAFAAANIAGASAWQTSWTSIRLGWTAYIVPFLFLFAPALLLQGNPFVVTFAVVTAILGIYATTAGMVGFTRCACGPLRRLILIVSGLAVLVPTDLFEGGLILNLVGLSVVLPAILIRTAPGESLKPARR